jgi:hypothetical protein
MRVTCKGEQVTPGRESYAAGQDRYFEKVKECLEKPTGGHTERVQISE